MWIKTVVVVSCILYCIINKIDAQGDNDLVQNLPGLIFNINFKIYSGYLQANISNSIYKLHYWLTESRTNPDTDPLLLWLNGGPGCSSFAGHFEELGPLYVNRDGQSLYENVFSWNQKANVLFLESPVGTGFSYDTTHPLNVQANDDLTAEQNLQALQDFFVRVQPRYANRTYYISGESYAGIYLPTLAHRLVQAINAGTFSNNNFQGMAVGNGYMNEKHLMNSLILWKNYHGAVSLSVWDQIKLSCCNNMDVDSCDFSAHMNTTSHLDFQSDNTLCGNLTVPLLILPFNMDEYNFYQDCYDFSSINYYRKALRNYAKAMPTLKKYIYHNTADLIYYDSTDNQFGYPCWNEDAVYKYLNRLDVQSAIHIDAAWQNTKANFTDCNQQLYNQYIVKYTDTTDLFINIIKNIKTPNFRILIYNGDVDTVCNYLGCAKLMRQIAANLSMSEQPRIDWTFRSQTAGYIQRYTSSSNITIDVLTGAGHFVPNDRPGPSLQMISNFIGANTIVNYSSSVDIDVTPKPAPLLSTTSTPSTSTHIKPIPIIIHFSIYIFIHFLVKN